MFDLSFLPAQLKYGEDTASITLQMPAVMSHRAPVGHNSCPTISLTVLSTSDRLEELGSAPSTACPSLSPATSVLTRQEQLAIQGNNRKGHFFYSTGILQQLKNELKIRMDQNSQLLWRWATPRSPLLLLSKQESPSCPQASSGAPGTTSSPREMSHIWKCHLEVSCNFRREMKLRTSPSRSHKINIFSLKSPASPSIFLSAQVLVAAP